MLVDIDKDYIDLGEFDDEDLISEITARGYKILKNNDSNNDFLESLNKKVIKTNANQIIAIRVDNKDVFNSDRITTVLIYEGE